MIWVGNFHCPVPKLVKNKVKGHRFPQKMSSPLQNEFLQGSISVCEIGRIPQFVLTWASILTVSHATSHPEVNALLRSQCALCGPRLRLLPGWSRSNTRESVCPVPRSYRGEVVPCTALVSFELREIVVRWCVRWLQDQWLHVSSSTSANTEPRWLS